MGNGIQVTGHIVDHGEGTGIGLSGRWSCAEIHEEVESGRRDSSDSSCEARHCGM